MGTWRGWYVLAVFSLVSMSQSMAWFVFSSVPASAAAFFALSEAELALLLNWGSIVYVAAALPLLAALATASPVALRRVLRAGAALLLFSSALRAIPALVPSLHASSFDSSSNNSISNSSGDGYIPQGSAAVITRVLLHTAQILNALVGPVVMSPVSLLSAMYFPPRLYALATNVAYFANGLGTTLLFVLGPALAPTPARVPVLLAFTTLCAALSCALAFVHFPLPPTSTSVQKSSQGSDGEDNNDDSGAGEETKPLLASPSSSSPQPQPQPQPAQQQQQRSGTAREALREFLHGARVCLRERSAAVATLCAGVQFGFVAGWAGCLPTVLMHLGMDARTAGALGLGETASALASALGVGVLAVTPCLRAHYRALSLVLWAVAVAGLGGVALFVPAPWAHAPLVSPTHVAALGVCFAAFGLSSGGLTPLYYEILAELTHPVSPSTSAGLVALLSNAATLVVIPLSPVLAPSVFLALVLAVLVLCALLCATLVSVRYRRREALDIPP